MEGRPGAAKWVLDQVVGRGWFVESDPAAINPKTQDVIWRVVGRPGVVLVVEGPVGRTQKMTHKNNQCNSYRNHVWNLLQGARLRRGAPAPVPAEPARGAQAPVSRRSREACRPAAGLGILRPGGRVQQPASPACGLVEDVAARWT